MPPEIPAFFIVLPVARSFRVTDPFDAPRPYANGKHEGLDFAATDTAGNPVRVLAAQTGVVNKIGSQPTGYGNYIRIAHSWGEDVFVTWYGHLSQVLVGEGQYVRAGDVIGVAGTTGFSTGIHLHLTLQHLGKGLGGYSVDDVVNPIDYLRLQPTAPFNLLALLTDVTVRDGSVMRPEELFTKTWQIRNIGTINWQNYRLQPLEGETFGAAEQIALPNLEAGTVGTVSALMRAPQASGKYRGVWVASDASGKTFGQVLDTVIEVIPPRTVETPAVDMARFVADVTIEDGTVIQPGANFTKTWRIRNSGTTTWKDGYRLQHIRDRRFNAPESVPLPPAAPGEIVDVSVPMQAPTQSGTFRSTWQPRNPSGQFFDFEMYAEIQVPTLITAGRVDEARYVSDVTIPDGTVLRPGQVFIKTWRVRNSGNTTWDNRYSFAHFGDERLGALAAIPLPRVAPGREVNLSLRMIAPLQPGTYRSTYKFKNPSGQWFEFEMYTLIEVK